MNFLTHILTSLIPALTRRAAGAPGSCFSEVRKCRKFPVVVLPEVGHIRATGENEKEATRVFYVAATRATQRLVLTAYGIDCFGSRLCLTVNSEN